MTKFTRKEIKESKKYIIYENNVYNVENYIENHPGGINIIKNEYGTDITEKFNNIGHSKKAKDILKKYLIGTIDENEISKKENKIITIIKNLF